MLVQNRRSMSPFLCFYLYAALLLSLCNLCSGQRAIFNLGTRIKKRFDKNSRKHGSSLNTKVVQGEKKENGAGGYFEKENNKNSFVLLLGSTTAIAAVVVSALSTRDEKKLSGNASESVDDIVIKDDQVVPAAGMDHVDLCFENISMVLESKKKNGEGGRTILDGSISGCAKRGRMLAIMGPSGAGKSSVVHALAGRVKEDPKIRVSGRRYVNDAPVAGYSLLPAAFIEQSVNFFPYMTVRETITFRVNLILGSLLSKSARDEMVADLLEQVGLTNSADTIVGNAKVRGISGGEKKRLSIAVEMIASPSLIFLDEPTSGLDSTAATSLVTTLRRLADSGKTVVAVIHQPSQHVFEKFDDLLVVSGGKLMYFGERSKVRSHMEKYACGASSEIGTAEHLLDCVSTTPMENESQSDADKRVEKLAQVARSQPLDVRKQKETKSIALSKRGGPRANILTQFKLLLDRSIREVLRAKSVIIIKCVQQISTAIIYGGIYSLGNDQSSIQDRIGLLSLIAIGSSNMAVATSIRSFPKEKAIVSNELAGGMYRTMPYFLGKAISEIPLVVFFNGLFGGLVYHLTGLSKMAGKFRNFLSILVGHGLVSEGLGLVIGAISPNSDAALALFPAILVLNVIFDGKNISIENTPRFLRWIPKLGLIRWGYEGLCINEFEGLEFSTGGPRRGPVAKTGAEALSRYGLGDNSLADVFKAHTIVTVSCWILSYLGLTLTRQKFAAMKDPSD